MNLIRPETPSDIVAIHAVNKQAFDNRESEPGLVNAIRNSENFIPELSLVAEENGAIAAMLGWRWSWFPMHYKR